MFYLGCPSSFSPFHSVSGPSKAINKKPSLEATMNFSPFLSSPGNSIALAMIQTNRRGRDKNWAFSTAATRSKRKQIRSSPLPFRVSNLHCGFITKRRVTLVEGFSSAGD